MTTETQEVELVSRITLKDLGCNPKDVKKLPENTPKLRLALIYGTVSRVGYSEDRNQGKTTVYFIGNFEGTNLQTGETVTSAKLFLPESASAALEGRVAEVQNKRGKGCMVQFAFEIRAIKANNSMGYAYETAAILKPEVADPIAATREFAKEQMAKHKPQDVSKKTA